MLALRPPGAGGGAHGHMILIRGSFQVVSYLFLAWLGRGERLEKKNWGIARRNQKLRSKLPISVLIP